MSQQQSNPNPPRCLIDQLKPGDIEPLKRLYTDPDCRRYLGGPVSDEEAGRRLHALIDQKQAGHAWAIRKDADSRGIGLVTLGQHHDDQGMEVSYLLLPEFRGRGITTRAVRLALDRAFQQIGLDQVYAETQSANHASVRLLKRVGMSLDRRVTRFGAEQSIFVIKRR